MNKNYSNLKPNNCFNDNIFLSKINVGNEESKNENVIYDNSISLLKHKVFLEKIMHLIKLSQMEYLSKISSNQKDNENKAKNNHNSIMIIKNILLNLKKDLMITLIENTENKAILQNLMNNKKSYLVNNLFGFEKENNREVKPCTQKKKTLTKSVNNRVKSRCNDEIYNVELPHLKLMNFKIANQLEYMSIIIKLKSQNLSRLYDSGNLVFCDNQNDINKASEYLHNNLIMVRNRFKSVVKKKDIQNRGIIFLIKKVNDLKEDIELSYKKGSNDYINTSQIINEESKENYTKTNVCTMENYKDSLKNNNNDFEALSFMKKNIVHISSSN
jgi:hypothetical protein